MNRSPHIRDLQNHAGGLALGRRMGDRREVWRGSLISTVLQSTAGRPGEGGRRVVHGDGLGLNLAWAGLCTRCSG